MDDKEKLHALVQKLTELGDDAQELGFWESIFDELEPEEKRRLLEILSEEFSQAEAASPKN